jgi:DNA primase
MFAPAFLDELRSRISVSTVVGRRAELRRAGCEWRGLSPFNKERTPSFFVNDQKQFWHDFSSGKGGDIFTFVMEMDGRTFPQGRRGDRRDGGALFIGRRRRGDCRRACRGSGQGSPR